MGMLDDMLDSDRDMLILSEDQDGVEKGEYWSGDEAPVEILVQVRPEEDAAVELFEDRERARERCFILVSAAKVPGPIAGDKFRFSVDDSTQVWTVVGRPTRVRRSMFELEIQKFRTVSVGAKSRFKR